ncbi:hypothetical protein BH09ACT10_BH09ACT10_16920 [soil metagenome]
MGRRTLDEALADVVAPVLQQLLPSENPRVVIASVRDGGQPVISVSVGEDWGGFYLLDGFLDGTATARTARLHLADELQDFIAESSFAWGERRAYADIETHPHP